MYHLIDMMSNNNKHKRVGIDLDLKDAVELVGGVVVEEEGQARPDGPHRIPVPGRQPCSAGNRSRE